MIRSVIVVVATMALLSTAGHASAAPARASCDRAVVLVHDIGSTESEWRAMASDLAAAGRCSFSLTYGANAVSPVVGVAGLTSVEDSAVELSSFIESVRAQTGLGAVDVIAHGAGGLVAQYYLDFLDHPQGGAPSIASLTTLGPVWGGTDFAGLATLADNNKRLGIYEQLAAVEAPILAPICPGCPQLIARSSLMAELDRAGYRTPGVRYTDIITRDDVLMSDPMSAAIHGPNSIVLQDIDPSNRTNHFGLADDQLARRLAVTASTPS